MENTNVRAVRAEEKIDHSRRIGNHGIDLS